MTLDQQKKFATHIQRLLKVRNVSFPIGNTEKGPLSLKYIKDASDFEIVLDAVPLNMNDYDNRELKSLLEKYLFDTDIQSFNPVAPASPEEATIINTFIREVIAPEKKKRGRPAGVKNKIK